MAVDHRMTIEQFAAENAWRDLWRRLRRALDERRCPCGRTLHHIGYCESRRKERHENSTDRFPSEGSMVAGHSAARE